MSFQQKVGQDSIKLNNESFHRPPVPTSQCIVLTKNYTVVGSLLKYDDDDDSQGYAQIKEKFRALRKDDILNPYISDHNFRSTKVMLLVKLQMAA